MAEPGARRPVRGRRRLRTRIILSFFVLGVVLTSTFALAALYVRNRLENQLVEATLDREVRSLVAQVEDDPNQSPFFLIFDARTWSDARAHTINPRYRDLEPGIHTVADEGLQGSGLREYRVAVRRGTTPDGKPFTALVRWDVTGATEAAGKLFHWLALAVLLFSLGSLVLGWWSASKVMRPVTDLAQRLRRSGASSDPQALATDMPDDEVGELARALDDYADRLTDVVQRDREFNADVSHELRTPLAVIKGAVEIMLSRPDLDEKMRERLLRIQRAEQQSTDLISALLLLSRNERAQGQCDVRKVAEHLLDSHRAQFAAKPVELRIAGVDSLVVGAPESAVSVALGNLIGNAVKYTPEGEVLVRLLDDAVEVADSGPGLSAEDAANLFTRGYRGTHAGHSQGGGIGLSIVRRLCELYGWNVSVRPGRERGVIARLAFAPGAAQDRETGSSQP